MTESVVKETRTEVTVEEVTETRFRCHVCEMLYDEGEVMRIGLDRDASEGSDDLFARGAQPRAERTVCHHCAEGLFDYEPDGESVFDESNTPATVDDVSVATVYGVFVLFVAGIAGFVALGSVLVGVPIGVAPAAIIAAVVGFVIRGWLA
jgi:hypothetical protein